MGFLSDIAGGSFQMTAGPLGVNLGDLVQMGPDGRAYTVGTIDYAAVANPGQVIAQTQVATGASYSNNSNYPSPAVRGSDGSIYTLSQVSGGTGVKVSKYTAAGALIGSVTVDSNAIADFACPALFFLSSGNLCAFWGGDSWNFAIVNPALISQGNAAIVTSVTAVDTYGAGNSGCAIPLGASGTVTFTNNAVAGDTLTIGGTAITFVSGTPAGNQVQIGASASATAANLQAFLVTAANAVQFNVAATVSGAVVTLLSWGKAVAQGTGSSITLATSDATNITLSGSTLSGGGGFATLLNNNSAYARFAIYSNTGAVVSAAASLDTTTAYAKFPRLCQISNGNLILSWAKSSNGYQYGIYSSTGTQVVAVVAAFGYSGSNNAPWLSALQSGFWAIDYNNASGTSVVDVYSNAGAKQGASYTNANASPPNSSGIVNDFSQFWWAGLGSAGVNLASIPTTGGASAQTYNPLGSPSSASGMALSYDNTLGGSFLLGITGIESGNSQCVVFAVNLSNPTTGFMNATSIGVAPGANGSFFPNILPAGDWSYIAYYDYQSTASMNLYVGKYASSAIEGVCVGGATSGNAASVQPNRIGGGTAAYAVNPVKGTSPKSFNHNSSQSPNITGNKGVISTYGAVLQGVA